jgi:hypothetical protein
MADPDLNFLARQIERLLANDASQHDDMAVLTAIVLRMDGRVQRQEESILALLNEIRAVHTQIARMNDRIRKLEGAGS